MALTDGLVALWHMNNDWLDSSGNGNNGTAYGGATFDTTNQKLGVAAGSFDGIDDSVRTINNVGITGASARTIATWVRFTTLGSWKTIYSYGADSAEHAFLMGLSTDGSNKLYFAGAFDDLLCSTILSTDTWYHVVVVYTGSLLTVYLNGSFENSGSKTLNTTDTVLYLGSSAFDNWVKMKGLIDELAIWNRAITTDEIAQLYNSGNGMEIGAATNSGLFMVM